MTQPALEILYEDNHLLAVNKPAGLVTLGVAEDEPSLAKWAKQYIATKYNKPGNVYLGVVSRLDRTVTGVVLLARTSKAAARLNEQFRERTVEKQYLAVVEGVTPPSASLECHVLKNDSQARMQVVRPTTPGGQLAQLSYERLAVGPLGTLLAVHLETGRKHQIRLQLAEAGYPVFGDRKYGGERDFAGAIALHAALLRVEHPTQKHPLTLRCPPPPSWRKFGFGAAIDAFLR